MIRQHLARHIRQVGRRISRYRLLRNLSIGWLLAALLGVGWILWGRWTGEAFVSPVTLVVVSAATVIGGSLLWNRLHRPDDKRIARNVEARFSELDERLLTAVDQSAEGSDQPLRYLQQQVVSEVLVHNRRHNWLNVVSSQRMTATRLGHVICLGAFIAVAVAVFRFDAQSTATSGGARGDAGSGAEYAVTVEPGDTSVERGSGFSVIARFTAEMPDDVTLVLLDSDNNEEARRIPLSRSLNDPLFGGYVNEVTADGTYRVEYDGHRTQDYRIKVFERPALLRADIRVEFPEYTGLANAEIPDARAVSFVEGSAVTIHCFLNKQVDAARLVDAADEVTELEAGGEQSEYRITLVPEKSQRYRLKLTDAEGRENEFPPEFNLTVVLNQRPELQLAFPARDQRVSPLEELPVEGTAWDDFGLKEYGVLYSLAGEEEQTVVLGEEAPGKETRAVKHLLKFEQLDARPDDLVSYYLFADDYGPEGELRRTYSDMYFAEVRHFEEIFREGQQPPGGQQSQQGGGQQQQTDQLVQLQKQILNATWKVYRRETGSEPGETFSKDVSLIEESQQSALEKVRELEAKVENPQSKALVKVVSEKMQQATEDLQAVNERTDAKLLSPALTSERGAYQALLKLRAAEHRVTRGQQAGGGGGGGGGNRSQQQLNQLELSSKENRYQTERQASAPAAANSEQLQVLNRLRELARRQGEINEKLKELQTALREAKTEEEREEIERRIKRLREEQQRMLRDADELQQRMNQPDNQSQMADSSRQLEQTRERMLQSSEALEKGMLSQALGAGTRAERELQNMKEEVRKKTAGQFSDQVKDLQERAGEMAEKQNELADRMDELQKKENRSLRDAQKRDHISEELLEQKQKLSDLQERMRKVIEQAEHSEPLLSNQLYETVREAREQQPEKALDASSKLIKHGLLPEAVIAEEIARKGIDTLKEGIDKAAESVLGNELDALKLAQNQLEQLSQKLQEEIAQADSSQQSQQNRNSLANGQQQSDSQQNAQNPSGSENDAQNSQQDRNQKSSGENRQQANNQQQQLNNSQQPNNSRQANSQNGGNQQSDNRSQNQSDANQQANQQSQQSQQSSNGNSQSQQSQQNGQQQGRNNSPSGQQSGNQTAGSPSSQSGQPDSQPSSILQRGGFEGGPGNGRGGVITGSNFQEWSDRMREVEEMIEDPGLRGQAEKIRERARSMRVEFKRHSKKPSYTLMRTSVYEPLVELQAQIAEEIARRESKEALVPIDRDPVPDRYEDLVQKYFQDLSRSQQKGVRR